MTESRSALWRAGFLEEKKDMALVLSLFAIILILFILEDALHRRNLSKIPVRVLVNGTRGKTTSVRLVMAALEEAGIKAVGKTTGSEAAILLPGSRVEKIRRRKGARLEENIAFTRRAVREGADVIVVECMALRDETQRMMAEKFIRPTHVAILNSLTDHAAEMGPEKGDVVHCLSCSVPRGSRLYVTEPFYDSLDADIEHVAVLHHETDAPLAAHDEDVSVALAILKDLGVDRETALKAFAKAIPDVGLQGEIALGPSRFIPSFAVNDEESMAKAIARESGKGRLTVVFNNRADREYRILYIEKALSEARDSVDEVLVVGECRKKVARHIEGKTGIKCRPLLPEKALEEMKSAPGRSYLALGNIKGAGERLIALAKEE